MRALAATSVALALLAAAAPQAAHAQRSTRIVLSLTSPMARTEASFARGEIEGALTEFIRNLPNSPPITSVTFPGPTGQLVGMDDARDYWEQPESTLAVMWGTMESSHGEYRVAVQIYIGNSDARSRLALHGDGYTRVTGYVGGSHGRRVWLYQLILGYALLVQAWRTRDGPVASIAHALTELMDEQNGRPGWSAPCRQRLSEAIDLIRRKAGAPLGRRRLGISPVPQPFTCLSNTAGS